MVVFATMTRTSCASYYCDVYSIVSGLPDCFRIAGLILQAGSVASSVVKLRYTLMGSEWAKQIRLSILGAE